MLRALITLEKILPIILGGLLMFGFDLTYAAVLTLIVALIHESAHLVALFLIDRRKRRKIEGHVFGIRLKADNLSYLQELFSAMCGPLINLLLGSVCLIHVSGIPFFDYIRAFGAINIATAVTNLLPIEGYDGYRIIRSLLMMKARSPYRVDACLYWVSVVLASGLCLISLYFLLKIGEGYWIFAIFFFVLLSLTGKRLKTTK